MAFRNPSPVAPAADQFHAYARSAGTFLVYAAVVALLLGVVLGSLNVWEQYDRTAGFTEPFGGRYYVVQFLQSFGAYALVAAVLFAGGMIVNTVSWFYSALSGDFDDLYDEASNSGDGDPGDRPPPTNPSDWTRPIGAD